MIPNQDHCDVVTFSLNLTGTAIYLSEELKEVFLYARVMDQTKFGIFMLTYLSLGSNCFANREFLDLYRVCPEVQSCKKIVSDLYTV